MFFTARLKRENTREGLQIPQHYKDERWYCYTFLYASLKSSNKLVLPIMGSLHLPGINSAMEKHQVSFSLMRNEHVVGSTFGFSDEEK